ETSEAPESSQEDASRRISTGKLAVPPLTMQAPAASEIGRLPAGTVVCTTCGSHNPLGMRFCLHYGSSLSELQAPASINQPMPASAPMQDYQAPVAKRRKRIMMPIYAGA